MISKAVARLEPGLCALFAALQRGGLGLVAAALVGIEDLRVDQAVAQVAAQLARFYNCTYRN